MSLLPHFHKGQASSMSRLMDDYDRFLFNQPLQTHRRAFAPTFDMRETKEGYQLEGELPGVKQRDLDIEFSDPHTMNIKGHTESKAEGEAESWWVSERMRGEFRRSFTFPSMVRQEDTRASLKDGVLSVTVPKASQETGTMKVKLVGDT